MNNIINFPNLKPLPIKKGHGFLGNLKDGATLRRKGELKKDGFIWIDSFNKYCFIPRGFIIDGASVPKIFHNFFGSTGMLFYGSLPHDFGYRYEGLIFENLQEKKLEFKYLTKKELDDIFEEVCLQEFPSHKKLIRLAKTALTLFGFKAGNKNRKENRNFRKDFPDIDIQGYI